jgi:hypothetical protein
VPRATLLYDVFRDGVMSAVILDLFIGLGRRLCSAQNGSPSSFSGLETGVFLVGKQVDIDLELQATAPVTA